MSAIQAKRVAIITSSDSGAAGTRDDISGAVIRDIVQSHGYVVTACQVLPDDEERLAQALADIGDGQVADLILTTGGTGFSMRDTMPEATKKVIEKEVPGIPEAMRAFSAQFTKRAMLSRGTAGIYKQTLIVNLPGSPKAVRECLEFIISELDHGLEIMLGSATNCAR